MVLPHAAEALVHWHLLLWDLLLCGGGEEETAIGFLKVEVHERMRTVVGVDVFEAEALDWYL